LKKNPLHRQQAKSVPFFYPFFGKSGGDFYFFFRKKYKFFSTRYFYYLLFSFLNNCYHKFSVLKIKMMVFEQHLNWEKKFFRKEF